ncbi:MAG: von Willebrand factor type A domain-containing protein, partial [Verrucomicrobiae bacterium]|nr:von Willebrand factor type A domain-containing protein [Verrucomicrobiae bacterium]
MSIKPPKHEREEIEARITAWLLGETNPGQEGELLRAIADDPDLARTKERMERTIALVKEAVSGASTVRGSGSGAPRLSEGRRKELKELFAGGGEVHSTQRRTDLVRWTFPLSLAAAFLVLATTGAILVSWPTLRSKTDSFTVAQTGSTRGATSARYSKQLPEKQSGRYTLTREADHLATEIDATQSGASTRTQEQESRGGLAPQESKTRFGVYLPEKPSPPAKPEVGTGLSFAAGQQVAGREPALPGDAEGRTDSRMLMRYGLIPRGVDVAAHGTGGTGGTVAKEAAPEVQARSSARDGDQGMAPSLPEGSVAEGQSRQRFVGATTARAPEKPAKTLAPVPTAATANVSEGDSVAGRGISDRPRSSATKQPSSAVSLPVLADYANGIGANTDGPGIKAGPSSQVQSMGKNAKALEVAEAPDSTKVAALAEREGPAASRKLLVAGDRPKVGYMFVQTERLNATAVKPTPEPQPEVLTSESAFSTFSLNISDVSFRMAAASIENGVLPSPASIRSEEFINAFDYRDPEPVSGMPLAFHWERAQYPFAHNREVIRFAIRTAAEGRDAVRALNLVLLLDTSGSMERADRVAIVREALRVLANQLRPDDVVSLVGFARTARLWVDGLRGAQATELVDRAENITREGGTNLGEALRVAYETAARHFIPAGLNRVVLLTDGAANLGDIDPESLRRVVVEHRRRGIALDCFGVGWQGYNDELLEALSRSGDGRYGFLNTPEEAANDFAAKLAGALKVAAADVKVQVEFDPRRVISWRQVGYAKHQ